MGRKPKYSFEQKIKACEDYLSGKQSITNIANDIGMKETELDQIYAWIKMYNINGVDAFIPRKNNNSYSKEFKEKVVKEYLEGKESVLELCSKYNLRTTSILRSWIKRYNNHIELKDYDPKPEVYMIKSTKKTYEEKIEIVKYCLEHNKDIKGTASIYGCNYAQLYQWIAKYEKLGEEGLIDKRGRRKEESQLTELEKANRKITQLEKEKEEFRKKYELLKKAEMNERW